MTAVKAHTEAGFRPNRSNAAHLAKDKAFRNQVAELLAAREEIHAQATAAAIEQQAWVIARLVENVERAMQAKPPKNADGEDAAGEYRYDGNVANRALELLGREMGMFISKVGMVDTDGSIIVEIRNS